MKNIPIMINGETSLNADDFNQIPLELENVISGANLSLDGNDLNQLGKVLTKSACVYDFYEDTGTENSIVLNATNSQPLKEYVNGLKVRFYTSNTNSGAMTVNIDGIGVKNIVDDFGNNISVGYLIANNYYEIIFKSSFNSFILIKTSSSTNIGSCIISPNGEIYDGYMEANGAALSRTTYISLFNKYGTFFGNGDGENTFNIPDYRGKFLRGYGGNSADLGITQEDAIRNITGTIKNSRSNVGLFAQAEGAFIESDNIIDSYDGNLQTNPSYNKLDFDASAVVPTAIENRPINMSIKYLIKY